MERGGGAKEWHSALAEALGGGGRCRHPPPSCRVGLMLGAVLG